MKKHKSISNWMTSALSKPPPSSTTNSLSSCLSHTCKTVAGKSSLTLQSKKVNRHSQKNRTRSSHTAGSVPDDADTPWTLKYQPDSVADLAVHKKKITEVEQWLNFALSPAARHPMLLLVGPPGCGKTATLFTLAKEMGCTILEWVNPVSDVGGSEADPQPGDLVVYPESQTSQFRNFLVRANRYPCLQVGGASGCGQQQEKKIVVVEEFPNVFLKDPSKFHDILNSLGATLYYPLVFIVSDSHCRDSSTHILFSKSAHSALDIHTISFNPIAHTTLIKTLLKIATSECNSGGTKSKNTTRGSGSGKKFHLPPREVIEQIAESSVGDIRSAVNALQFTCLADSSVGGVTLGVKGQRNVPRKHSRGASTAASGRMKRHASFTDERELAAIGGRDHSLFLFRALGKILYCKRESVSGDACGDDSEQTEGGSHSERDGTPDLPAHLHHHKRSRLLIDPESVLEHSHLSSDMFVLYLHQNYLHMHSHVDDVVRASEYLSASDLVSRLWTDSQTTRVSLQRTASSLACRGLMHSYDPVHTSVVGGNKWRPLHKPQWIGVNHKYRDKCQAARHLFLHLGQSPHAHLWTPIELQTEILPHLALTNMPVRNPDQAALMQSLTHFSHGYRFHAERLEERDTETVFTQDIDSISFRDSAVMCTDGNTGSVPSQESGSGFHTISQDVGMGSLDSPDEIEDFDDDMIW